MDLRTSESDEKFRAELRGRLAETLPTLPRKPAPEDWPARRSYDTAWQRKLFEVGYAGIGWPVEYGGRGATPTEQLIFAEELLANDAALVNGKSAVQVFGSMWFTWEMDVHLSLKCAAVLATHFSSDQAAEAVAACL